MTRGIALTQDPAAAETHGIDKDFTPRDVAKQGDSVACCEIESGDVDKAMSRSISKSVRSSVKESVRESVKTSTQQSIAKALDDDDGTAARAVEQLSALGGRVVTGKTADDRPVLLANILRTESDPSLRRIAAWGLSEYADTQVAVEALANALRRDSDASVREMAAWALNEAREGSAAAGALSAALRGDASERVRATSAWALGNLEDRDGLPALAAALSDASKSVRMRALWAIGQIEPRPVPAQAVSMLKDANPEVRELAAWVMYQAEDPSTAAALNEALRVEQNKDLQIAYIRALAALGEKSVDAIRGLLTSSDPKIKSMAIRALAGGNAAGPWPWPWPEPRPFP